MSTTKRVLIADPSTAGPERSAPRTAAGVRAAAPVSKPLAAPASGQVRAAGARRSGAVPRAPDLAASFHSILFPGLAPGGLPDAEAAPGFFRDLNLDQIVEAVTAGKQDYDLIPFCPLRAVDALEYRHDVIRDLQDPAVLERIRAFAAGLRTMRGHLATAQKLHYKEQSDAWFVDAVEIYCEAVASLAADLNDLRLQSRGFRL